MIHVSTWVLSGYSTLLPQHSDKHVKLIGGSKLRAGVTASVCGCLLCYVSPVLNRQPDSDRAHPVSLHVSTDQYITAVH